MRNMYFATVVATTLAWANSANAAGPEDLNQLLKGTFSQTGTGACAYSAKGFDDKTRQPLSPLIVIHEFSNIGTTVFNGDGTGSVDFTLVFTPVLNGMIESVHATAPFTYDVAPNRTVTIDTGPVTATAVIPPVGTNTVDHFKMTGRLSQDHRSLTQAATEPEVETLTFANGSHLFRICSRSLVLIKVNSETE